MLSLGEVEVVGLDVRTFGDREAHVGEDLDALVVDLAHGMDAPLGNRAQANRQRDIARSLSRRFDSASLSSAAVRASSAASPAP